MNTANDREMHPEVKKFLERNAKPPAVWGEQLITPRYIQRLSKELIQVGLPDAAIPVRNRGGTRLIVPELVLPVRLAVQDPLESPAFRALVRTRETPDGNTATLLGFLFSPNYQPHSLKEMIFYEPFQALAVVAALHLLSQKDPDVVINPKISPKSGSGRGRTSGDFTIHNKMIAAARYLEIRLPKQS